METRERAQKAASVLDSEVFKHAQDEAAKALIDQWILCDDAAEREALWHQYHALDGVARQLRIYRDRGITEERKTKK